VKFKQIDAGFQHCIALSADGDVFTWGKGNRGQLGDGAGETSVYPVSIALDNFFTNKARKQAIQEQTYTKGVAVSAGFSHTAVLGSDGNSNFTAILADIGGGTTDIAVVNDGGVEGTKMFGIGGRSFTQTIASDMNLSYKDAEKLKVNIDHEQMKPTVKKDVNEAIDKTLEVWIAGVELALSEFDSVDHLPNRILLCGGGSSLDKLVHVLEGAVWHKDLPFTKKPIVQHINPNEVLGVSDTTGDVSDHTFITAMGLLRVGYDTLVGSGEGDSIKEKFNRLLKI
jgi:cell division protein FtsA